ncbi:sodium/hydrogen exchanger [Trifolium repens]|nr:sodium/hydrogen exchanger [Trifolium repens]
MMSLGMFYAAFVRMAFKGESHYSLHHFWYAFTRSCVGSMRGYLILSNFQLPLVFVVIKGKFCHKCVSYSIEIHHK